MVDRARYRVPRVEVGSKSPMEDFLFILVISLATTMIFFAKQQMSHRFALAERRGDPEMLTPAEYNQLPQCVIAAEGEITFAGASLNSSAELIQHLRQVEWNTNTPVLLRIHRDSTIGDAEDIKNAFFDQNIQILVEWEERP